MLVGATGSGKSTLVDGFVNYLMGVSFDDPFRFTTAMLEHEEMKTHNQVNTCACIFSLFIHIYNPFKKQTLVIQRLTTHTNEHAHARKNHTIFFPQF